MNSHQQPSAAINSHQQPSTAINSHQQPSTAINSHQQPSTAINSMDESLSEYLQRCDGGALDCPVLVLLRAMAARVPAPLAESAAC